MRIAHQLRRTTGSPGRHVIAMANREDGHEIDEIHNDVNNDLSMNCLHSYAGMSLGMSVVSCGNEATGCIYCKVSKET